MFFIAFLLNIIAVVNNYSLNSEIVTLKTKEFQKIYKPLSKNIKSDVNISLKSLLVEYPDFNNDFTVMCVNPSKDTYQKALELVELFKSAGINTSYTNTILSADKNIILLNPSTYTNDFLSRFNKILLKIFKLKQIFVKQNDKNELVLYI